jgi:glycosyltransferase involved in cell wall biosynthesis
MKVLWLFNHPAPYKIDFFNLLGEQIDLTVLFERCSEDDRGPAFYYEKAKSFKEEIFHSLHLGVYNNYTAKPLHEIQKNHYDIIVINGWSTLSEMQCIAYLKKHKIPYIFAINGGIVKENEAHWKDRLKRKYLPGAKLYLSPDAHSADYLVHYGVDEQKIRLYPYATIFTSELVKEPLSKEERRLLRQEEGIEGEEVFLSAGSFIKRKNDLQLLEIWQKVSPEKTLLLMGDGPEKGTYESFIKEHHLSNVHILPFKPHPEVLRYFRMADASIFLTREDIYGHVVNECLSQGTPVISSTRANSALNLIVPEANGRLVNLEDERSILEAIEKPLAPTMGEEALQTAKANTLEKMVASHLAIFKDYLSL